MLNTVSALGVGVASLMVMGNQIVTNLSVEEQSNLLYMREEEQLARDVYLTLGEAWDLQIFENIARSEQRHMDLVAQLLVYYELPDPLAGGTEVGVFENLEIQSMYDDLVAKGLQSETDALGVGKLIEELDIKDLQDAIDATDEARIKSVYGRLLNGSYNHLLAFNRQLGVSASGVEAALDSTEALAASQNIESPKQSGRRGGGGPGFGRRWGR